MTVKSRWKTDNLLRFKKIIVYYNIRSYTTMGFKKFGQHNSQFKIKISTTDKILLKCDGIDGSTINGVREPKRLSFALVKLPGFIFFCESLEKR